MQTDLLESTSSYGAQSTYPKVYCACQCLVLLCVYVHMSAGSHWRQQSQVPWSWSWKWFWATRCGCWELNLGTLKEQYTLLNDEPSLYPRGLFLEQISELRVSTSIPENKY